MDFMEMKVKGKGVKKVSLKILPLLAFKHSVENCLFTQGQIYAK